MLTLSDVEISNTGRRQDNKAEATQAEPGSTSMTVSFGNVYVCVSGKGKGEQKGVNVHVRIENNGLGMCVAVWWLACVSVCILHPCGGGEGVH